jgi:hypothetical protein
MGWWALAVVGALVVGLVLYRLLQRRPLAAPAPRRSAGIRPRPGPRVTEASDEYAVLVTMTLGDHAKAERLIALERTKDPGADRARLIQSAIERWRRDHRG